VGRSATLDTDSDQALTNRIIFRLETDPLVKKYDLTVDVSGGAATLRGDVATAAQRTRAVQLATTIKGVSKVNDEIRVDKDIDQTLATRAKAGLRKTGEKMTDAWITTKVKWFFVGDDLLKGSDVRVETSDRVVTLAGLVKSSAGKARAVQLAQGAEGVVRVVDQLMVGTPRP
jgi:hyperosmotically inducible protein